MDSAQKLQDQVTTMMERLEKGGMRKIQGDTFRCSAKCCDDNSSSMDAVQRCLTNCAQPLENLQRFIQGEIENFESRFTRCVSGCQDEIRDKMGRGGMTPELQTQGEKCLTKCANSLIDKLPDLEKKIKDNISQYR